MFKPMIEFCASNINHGTEALLDKYEADENYEAVEYGCLGNCGECYLKPFVLVNGHIVVADTVEQLEQSIAQYLRDEEENMAAFDKLLDDL